jgi:hypothetical protein
MHHFDVEAGVIAPFRKKKYAQEEQDEESVVK